MLEWISDHAVDTIDRLGYVGVALLVALENLFPPIPSEVVLPFAGFVSRDGEATLAVMIAAATLGSLVGAWALYGVAAWIGPDRLERALVRYGRWLRLTPGDITRAERWFDQRATLAVTLGRCVPLIRSLISVPAGFRRMPFVRFTACTLVGSAIWNTTMIGAGYVLRSRWQQVEPVLAVVQYVAMAAIVVLALRFVHRRRRLSDRAPITAEQPR